MTRRLGVLAGAAMCLAYSGSPVFGQAITITDGDAIYRNTVLATTVTGAGNTSDLLPNGVAPDSLFQNAWWYRVAGDAREFPIGNYAGPFGTITTTVVTAGNQFTYSVAEPRFNATWAGTLLDGASPDNATLHQSFTVNNPGGSPLSIALFNYSDFDVGGTTSNTATGNGPPVTEMQITNGTLTALFGGDGASAFQVMPFAQLRTLLANGTVEDFNNTGLPFGPGDFTGGYQWNLVVPAGGSLTVSGYLSIGPVVPIPEPGTLTLCGVAVAGGLVKLRRRKTA